MESIVLVWSLQPDYHVNLSICSKNTPPNKPAIPVVMARDASIHQHAPFIKGRLQQASAYSMIGAFSFTAQSSLDLPPYN